MNRNTLIWLALLVASVVGMLGSGIWLVVSGYQADEDPGGPLILTPWLTLLISIAMGTIATVVLIRRAASKSG